MTRSASEGNPKEQSEGALRALLPFLLGPAEVLLVPNKVDGIEPTVLLVIRHQASTVSHQLSLTETRQLATYLSVAANEAEALSSCRSATRTDKLMSTSATGQPSSKLRTQLDPQ